VAKVTLLRAVWWSTLAAEAISAARQAGCTGPPVFRIDSAYYTAAVLGVIGRGRASFSVTVPMDAEVRAAIAAIGESAWPRHDRARDRGPGAVIAQRARADQRAIDSAWQGETN